MKKILTSNRTLAHRFACAVFFLFFALALSACGGSSNRDQLKDEAATAGAITTPIDTSIAASTVEVLTASNTLPSAAASVVITAFVKNASNVGLEGKAVVFSASSGTLEVTSALSDAAGSVSAKLTAGSDKSLRNITVTVTAGTASGSIVIAVVDTAVSIAGSGSVQVGAPANTYTVRAVDSAGNPVAGAALSASSALGNAISLASATTSSAGASSFSYTPTIAGTDTVTVSALGAQAKTTVLVNAIDFAVLTPASNTNIAVGATGQTMTVRYKVANAGVAGSTVTFSSTRGTVTPATAVTDANGDASTVLTSTTAGAASAVAQISGVGQVSLPVLFTATTPSTVVVQANPAALLPNAVGSTSNQSNIEAVVRDASGNVVANTQVTFSMLQDLSNGNLSPGVALTDSNGRAQVQFVPGTLSTAANGVVIQASAGNPAVSGTVSLTVNGRALFISLAYGNTVADVDTTTYTKTFSAYVTDANGAAVANQSLTLSVLPEDYDKGSMVFDATSNLWSPVYTTPGHCVNEDTNRNGILDAGEDINANGALTPGNVAVLVPGAITTDTLGRSTFEIQYGKPFATWARMRLTARATVAGTESSQFIIFRLPIAVADAGDATIPPPAVNSPFGQSAQCTDAL